MGQPLVYEIVVRNAGAVPATQLRVEDELPAGTRYLTADPAAALQGERLAWVLENLPPGAERRIRVQVQPGNEGEWTSRATVSVAISSSLRTRVVRSGLTLAVSLTGPETVSVGQPAQFQIRVTNTGSQALNGLVLRERVPPGLQHPAGSELEADLGSLEPGKTRTIPLTTRAVAPGQFTNDAVVITPDGQQAEAHANVQILANTRAPN
jgi:uncharacterized repeat protein (TIGR01451 family)